MSPEEFSPKSVDAAWRQLTLIWLKKKRKCTGPTEPGQVYSQPRLAAPMMRLKDESSNMELMEAPSSVFKSSQN